MCVLHKSISNTLAAQKRRRAVCSMLNDNQTGGTGTGDYGVLGNNITLYKKHFEDTLDNPVTLTLNSTGYEPVLFSITYSELEGGNSLTPVPEYVKLYNTNAEGEIYENVDLEITTGSIMVQDYNRAITDVLVNDEKVNLKITSSWSEITINASDLQIGENIIVIKATGYEDAVFNVLVSNDIRLDVATVVGVASSQYASSGSESITVSTNSINSMPNVYFIYKASNDYYSEGHIIDTLTINGNLVTDRATSTWNNYFSISSHMNTKSTLTK